MAATFNKWLVMRQHGHKPVHQLIFFTLKMPFWFSCLSN
nr:MAG TPA: hypothetical protein [Caudoviricetes sp.]